MREKKTRNVLVVDDDHSMRRAIARVLLRSGFEVTQCPGGAEALDALRTRPWDAMVSDVRMPEIDGNELLRRGLALRPELPVIMVTAFGTIEDAVRAVQRGACDYLLKPFAPETLLASLRRVFSSRDVSSESYCPPIGNDPNFTRVLDEARRASACDATVLIGGESGSGKEVVARWIHHHSRRASGPFVAINCAALPEQLLEAELFGVRRGAFTGADEDRNGLFARAGGGTLLLDEIGDCPLEIQAKLLRAIEERRVTPLGSSTSIAVDIRILASTHQDLSELVEQGRFRRDLFFRLRVIPVEVPPLRARSSDIGVLARHFAEEISEELGRKAPSLTEEAIARLESHPWPGNVRELRNVLERAVVLDQDGVVDARNLVLDDHAFARSITESTGGPLGSTAGGAKDGFIPGMTIAQAERKLIERTLDAAGGNRTRASEMLGISVRTLRNKLKIWREEESAAGVSAR